MKIRTSELKIINLFGLYFICGMMNGLITIISSNSPLGFLALIPSLIFFIILIWNGEYIT